GDAATQSATATPSPARPNDSGTGNQKRAPELVAAIAAKSAASSLGSRIFRKSAKSTATKSAALSAPASAARRIGSALRVKGPVTTRSACPIDGKRGC